MSQRETERDEICVAKFIRENAEQSFVVFGDIISINE